ncbi:MAG: ABC transporter ATP-binding protein [Chloroflexi bacterium]|nr:ABC transporter ATP-binding protein [Chloroflexota bacterium]
MHGRLGSALEEEGLGKLYDHQVVIRLFKYVKPNWRLAAISIPLLLVNTATSVAVPWLVKIGIDSLLVSRSLHLLGQAALALLALALINFVSGYFHQLTLAKLSQGVLYSLRSQMFHHLQRLSVSFYDRNEVGRVMSRVQNDVVQLQEFLSVMVLSLADLLSLVGIVAALLLMNVPLAAIALAVIPVLFGVMVVWQRYARRSFMEVRRAIALVNTDLQENISGVRVIQSLSRENTNIQRFDRYNAQHLDANIQAGRLSAAVLPVVEVLTAASMALVVGVGGVMSMNGALAVSTVIAFVLYIQRFFDPIRNLTMQYTQVQRAMVSGTRIFELLDTRPEVQDAPEAKELPPVRGEIRFEGVRFAYTPGVEVLKGIDIHIRPGETVALVGATGAGKTTVTALMARFYDVTAGRITVDGYDIRDVTRASLARQMAMVLQEPFLYSATVKENICFNRLDATDEQVVAAAEAVGAHEFIMKLPQGYDTVLQERGQNLSMGQRQLVSFARALLADPCILILDEATASIDSGTEALVQEALRTVLRARTAIVIAHRLSTVRNADRIVVLDQGQVMEEGTHQDLLARGGRYADLYRTYFAAGATAG